MAMNMAAPWTRQHPSLFQAGRYWSSSSLVTVRRRPRSAVVVTFLSPSLAASHRIRDFLLSWSGLVETSTEPEGLEHPTDDQNQHHDHKAEDYLNLLLRTSRHSSSSSWRLGGGSATGLLRWDSISLTCPRTGTLLHWLSPPKSSTIRTRDHDDSKTATTTSTTTSSLSSSSWASVFSSVSGWGWRPRPQPLSFGQVLAVQQAQNIQQARDNLALALRERWNTPSSSSSSSWWPPYRVLDSVTLRLPWQSNVMTAHDWLRPSLLPILTASTRPPEPTGHISTGPDTSSDRSAATPDQTMSPPSSPSFSTTPGLKELVIPVFDDAAYPNGSTLFEVMAEASSSHHPRPPTGLYALPTPQDDPNHDWPPLYLRPLPTARLDRHLAPVSLIFYAPQWDPTVQALHQAEAVTMKIGYSGTSDRSTATHSSNATGQLKIGHQALLGLDCRISPTPLSSSMFAEAQESLLAGSLPALQSRHVLQGAQGAADPKTLRTDCWVEFRAQAAQPAGYFGARGSSSSSAAPRIANVPNLPSE